MAPTIPIDYTGQKVSKKFSKTVSGDMMGKTRKVSKGYSTGFVPDYRHAVETVADSDGFGSPGRTDTGLTSSQHSCVPKRKFISSNVDGCGKSAVPIRYLSVSEMSPLERRDLEMMLKSELEQVKKLQRKITSFSLDAMVHPPDTDNCSHHQNGGPKRHAVVESLPMYTNDGTITPGKKKIPPGKNGPRTKGAPVPARRMEPVKHGVPQSTNFSIVMKQCETLLSRMMLLPNAWLFNEPVDVVKHKAPDYYNVIKHPMDLGTVKSNLLSNLYSSPMEFAADVRLTFKNAMTFNPPENPVHGITETLSKYFEVRWKTIEKKLPPTVDVSTTLKPNAIVEPESAYMPPAKKQKTYSRETKVQNETVKRTMSDVDKQKLGAELEALMAELPDNIINFLKEITLSCNQVAEDEIEIDIDALSDDTLFTLRKLLDDFIMEKKKKQSTFEHHDNEMLKESGSRDLCLQPCKDNEQADEDVDIGGNDPPPVSSSPTTQIYMDAARRKSNCSSSRSSSSESGSSSTDSDTVSSACEPDGPKSPVPAKVNETADTQEPKESDPDFLNGKAEQYSVSNSMSVEPICRHEGESAPPERQVSPEKLYRAALLRSRFADIIIKAQENSNEKGEKPDPEKLKLEREDLERRRREEKARLQAEAKAAEEARKKAEAEAAAEARRKRELEREAARQALLKMEKTVEINENSHFMEDLEMLRSGSDEHLHGLIDEMSPENTQNGFGSFKFRANSNPLEQLGLYMKNDEEEEEDAEPQSALHDSNDTEEGEID